jgi:hypothetical protein
MDDAPKGWKGKAKRPAKVAGGVTLAGVLMFAATELRTLVHNFVEAQSAQATALQAATQKLEDVKTEHSDALLRLEEREDRKDERVFLELQAQRRDIRDLRNLILHYRQELGNAGRSASAPFEQSQGDG